MLLYHTGPSPYGRKVLLTAVECGLRDQIEIVPTNPHDSDAGLLARNPLSKVPTLVCDDGSVLFDSLLICEYLDSLHAGPKLIPATGNARWRCLRRHALAQGIIDCSVTRRVEGWRAPDPDRLKHIQRMVANTNRALDEFEREPNDVTAQLSLDQITLGCALGFLDFRFPDHHWRQGRPSLASWFAEFDSRQSMRITRPQDAQ
jgi:glutathione S-transferase